jgi:general secretion pathway protein M
VNANSLPTPLASLRAQTLAWWNGLAARERGGAALAMSAVGLLLLWAIAVQPALRTLREVPPKLDQLDTELQKMHQLAFESRNLRAIPTVAPGQAAAALQTATERLGEKAHILVQNNRATLTLNDLQGDALAGWLAEARSIARARPVEAQWVRGPHGYSGTLIVGFGEQP